MAEDVSASLGWQLADAIRAMVKQKTGPTTGTAQYVGKDSAGNALVLLPGAEQPTPVQGSISASVEVGSTVTYSLANGRLSITGNASDPAVGEAKATEIADAATRPIAIAQRAIGATADAAKRVAEEASAAASATRQHFWTDDSGVHVTDDEGSAWQEEYAKAGHGSLDNPTDQRPWHNVLVNSLGILLRRGLRNLVSITHGAVAFYDGQGNEASNVTASFGATGAQIGKDNARHAVMDSDGLTVYNADGTIAPVNATVDGANILDASIVGGKIQGATLTGIPYAAITNADIEVARVADAEISSATITQAQVKDLSVDYAQANLANVSNAWIDSGVVRNGAITNAMINSVSANKLTAGTIDASEITVTNLNADNITVGTINGGRIGDGSLSLDKLSESVYTEAEVNDIVDGLNDRIDGAIETFTGTAVPTLNNAPASSWNTTKLRDEHVGDVYYVVNSQSQQNGYCYRFTKSGSTYSWQLIKDSDVTAALSRLQTAEGKITTFDSDISTLKTDTGELKTKTQSLETSLGDKVDVTTFNELSSDVEENSASITTLSNTVSQKADSSTVTTLSNTVNTVKQTADTNKTSITNLTKTVSDNKTSIENRATTIEQNLSGITTRVSKTEAELDTVSNPNLSPFFSFALDNYYSASSNPDGYWCNNNSTYVTKLSDGWVHYERNNTGSDTVWLTIYEHSAWRHAHGDLKGSTKYTVMIEFRNVTKSGSVSCIGTTTHHSSWPSMFVGNSDKGNVAVEDGVQYHIGTTVADPSSVTGSTCTTRTLITSPSGSSIKCDFRVSLYEGEYSGPYKPYVDQTLSNRVKLAETSIEQNSEQIALRATKTEVLDTGNMLKDTSASSIEKVYGPANRYWSDTNYTHITTSFVSLTDPPEPGITHAAQFVSDGSKASNTGRALAFYSADNAMNIPMKEGQTYTASWWARKTSGNGRTRLMYRSGGASVSPKRAGTTDYDDELTTEWKQYTRTFTMGEVTNYNRVWFYAYFPASTAGTVQLCGFKLIPAAYATAAELKVASDSIDLKVSKNDVINQINVSTEGAKIDADKVEINGAAIFTAISSDVDDAITSKGYQTSSQVESAITSKGYATTTQAQGYATTAKSEAISAAATDATTKANAAEANAKAYANALEIGGRNLLPNSQDWSGAAKRTNGTIVVTSDTYGGCSVLTHVWGSGNSDVGYQGNVWTQPIEADAWYTLSFWAKASSAIEGMSYFYLSNVVDKGINSSGKTTTSADGAIKNTITTEWQRIWVSWHIKADATSFPQQLIVARLQSQHSGVTLYLAGPKLEKGNKATDWTPAPEDIEASAVKRTQRIWYRKSASGAPSAPSAWVTKADDGNDAWTKMHIAISSTHKYIYTCEQYEMANGTVGYTSVLLDNTITVIDGGSIITGTVTANEVNFADATGNQLKLFDPSNPTSYQVINGSGNELFVDGESVANFGELARVGKTSSMRTEIEPGTFTIKDSNGAYLMRFYSRNTNSDGSATVSMSSTGNGSTMTFTPMYAPSEVVSAAYTDGTALETPTISGKAFVFATAPSAKSFIVTYKTLEPVYYASLGTRLASDSSGTYSQGNASMALGRLNAATTQGATAIGRNNKSTATDSYTLGRANQASAMYAFAMGNTSTASANSAIAIGNAAEASATDATAIGNGAYAGGTGAIAMGNNATAIADNSYALGRYVSAESSDQMVIGRYNEADNVGTYSFVIGNGSSASDLHNALAVDSETGKVHSWNKSSGSSGFVAQRDETGTKVYFIVGSGGINHGVWSGTLNRWLVYADESNAYINNNLIMDSVGWTNLKLSSTAEVYSDASYTPKYCRKCGIVYLAGAVTPKATVSAQGTLTIGTLPVGCRPMVRTVLLCQGSTAHEWSLTIEKSGVVEAGRYRKGGTFEEMPSGAWLTFSVAFVSADAY